MNWYAIRIVLSQPLRLAITVIGIALCILLMLFLLSVYRGVKHGSVEYIRQNECDLWVLQRNAWNILRGSSLLSTGHGLFIEQLEGIEKAAPVLFILSGIEIKKQMTTVFLTGFDPEKGLGGPPVIVAGRNVRDDNEIVLDRSFAVKYNFRLGEPIKIKDDTLTIVGWSGGTNAFVIQYAFTTLKRAQSIIGFPSLVTCYAIKIGKKTNIPGVVSQIKEELPDLEVFDHQTFLNNNIKEMESGFLPLLYTVAIIGMVVLTTILSLLLSINILEQRKDFAVFKTLGSPETFLWHLIFNQAILILGAAIAVAIFLFYPTVEIIEKLVPEIDTKISLLQILSVIFISVIMGIISSLISQQRIRKIYPMEAFA
jgi:ABC-type antimicrobial peptide transport system permease subunit